MELNFKGKTALVTGATRGIGQHIAGELQRLGAELILTGTEASQIERLNKTSQGRHIKYLQLDFLDDSSVAKFLESIRQYKRINVCINNAGINRINYLTDFPLEDWDKIIKVNLSGPFIISKEVAKIMQKNRYGRIVNIASIFGVITREKRSAYTAAKSGLIGLTKTTALELAPYNILVNSLSPGFILTDLTKRMLTEKEREELKAAIPLGRLGMPQDVCGPALFLASDLNSYITGQNLIVDGGYVTV